MSMQQELYYEQESKDLKEYLAFISRRRLPMILTALLVLAIALATALLLSPSYRSIATILIEEQEIPTDLVRTTISSYADQRLQVISQQVMTRGNLQLIIDKYDLYPRQRRYDTAEEILGRMRKDIKLDLVTADVIDRRSGNPTTATIAFTLSFDNETGEKAQRVANELVSLYLNENLKNRQQTVAEASSFLAEEADRLVEEIAEIEQQLAGFKSRNMGSLPGLVQLNMQLRDRTEDEINDVERELRNLEERRFYLEAQLQQMKPHSPIISASGERIPDSYERLRALEARHASLSGIYSAEHPDLRRLRAEIGALREEVGQTDDSSETFKQLDKAQVELVALRERYSDQHPDVRRTQRRIEALEASLADEEALQAQTPERKPENPAYISMQSQLDALNRDMESLEQKGDELRRKRALYEARLEQTPQVEREFLDLSRDHENTVLRYREIKAKLMEAQVAQELEKDSKAERFSLIDPPQYPEKPRSPNRPAILLVGLVLAIGGAVGYGGVLEGLDRTVKGAKDLGRTVSLPLLSVIPYIENDAERRRRRMFRMLVGLGVVIAAGILLVLIHYFWMPLEVFWYYMLRRLNIG